MWPAPIINSFFYSFSANVFPPTYSSYAACSSRLSSPLYPSIFPLLCFFNIDSPIGLIFIHRHTNRSSSTHCTLLWRAINSRLTLGDRWARHPWHFLRDFHDRLPAACAEHMYPLTVFCLSLLGIRESAGVNRFPCTSGILYVCIHTLGVYSFNECSCLDRTDSASSFAYGLYRGEGIHFSDDFPVVARWFLEDFQGLIDRNKSSKVLVLESNDRLIDEQVLPLPPKI